jgi:multiple sugar transport system permease protein
MGVLTTAAGRSDVTYPVSEAPERGAMTETAITGRPVAIGKQGLSDSAFAWLLILPSLLFIAVIVAWPLAETIRLSFTNATIGNEEYVGLANYAELFGSQKFFDIVGRTFWWMFVAVSLKIIIGLIGASLLSAAVPGRALFRMLIMPPWIIPIAIGCIGWKWLYNGYFGLINGLMLNWGLFDERLPFLATKTSAFYSAVVTDVWVGTPMVTLFFLAAMQGVNRDLYEAAWVDGAGWWYRFRRITIPQIMPVIVSMALLSAIWTFNSFEIIWILTEGGPRSATTTLIIDTYKVAISSQRFGEGAARAVIIVVLLALFSLAYFWFLRRVNKHYGAA